MNRIWESLLPHRFIMTFKVEGFSVPKLKERLTDLVEQDIFNPRIILMDGLPFDASVHQVLPEMKALAGEYGVQTWFAVTTHRHEAPGPDGMPLQLAHIGQLFETVVQLQPDGKEIHVKLLKGSDETPRLKPLILDPSTMLVMENK
jgi:hypothetical protein